MEFRVYVMALSSKKVRYVSGTKLLNPRTLDMVSKEARTGKNVSGRGYNVPGWVQLHPQVELAAGGSRMFQWVM